MELLIPFANTGDKQDFDTVTAPDGSMSLEKGFTTLFELKPEEGGLFILRREFNQLMYLMSKANVEFNTQSFSNWIADAGSGTPYAYNTYAIVRYTDGKNYVSLIDSNTEEPTTGSNWQELSLWIKSLSPELPSITGTATFTNSTNNIQLNGLGGLENLEIGDVLQIFGTVSGQNDGEYTVEVITDANNVIVNQAHAGGTTSKSLINEVGTANVTVKILAKWYNASNSLGRGWVDMTSSRAFSTPYANNTGRGMDIAFNTRANTTNNDYTITLTNGNMTLIKTAVYDATTASNARSGFELTVEKAANYSLASNLVSVIIENWFELR